MPRPASSPTRTSSSASRPSTCSTSTTSGAENRTEWVLEQLYALVNERYEAQRSLVVTTNLEEHELEEQIGARVVSRLVEMCGDPLPLFDEDRRMRVSADVATSLGEGGGSALGPLDH